MSIDRNNLSGSNLSALAQSSGGVQALDERDLTFAEDLGKYRLLGALGSGGMADVFLAVADGPEGFRKLCVLKLLKETMTQDEDFRAMFLDEARLAARLNHPHIVQTFEVGETQHRLMIAMEYIEGQPATRARRRLTSEQFPLTSYVSILCDVLDALEYAHGLTDFNGSKLGIVHRDVSPHNIIIGYDGRAKLVDFGIAKSSAAVQQTQAGVLKGKAAYMAPEQATMRRIDGRTDIFSVGVVLWEAIAGRRLADGMTSNDVLVRRIEGGDPKIADVVPDVDPHLAAMCDRAMALDPNDRFPTAADFQLELEAWLKERGEPSRKALAKVMREAFREEREQLRALVEHRMGDSSPNLSRTGSSMTAAPPRVSAAPPDAGTPPYKHPQSPSTVSLAPVAPAQKGALPGAVIAGLAVLVSLAAAATLYVVARSSRLHTSVASAGNPSAQQVPSSPSSALPGEARGDGPSATAGSAVPASSLSAAPSATSLVNVNAPNGRPTASPPSPAAFRPPLGGHASSPPGVGVHPSGPAANGANTGAPAGGSGAQSTPSTAGLTTVQPSKPPTRPLDEKDPYAQ